MLLCAQQFQGSFGEARTLRCAFIAQLAALKFQLCRHTGQLRDASRSLSARAAFQLSSLLER